MPTDTLSDSDLEAFLAMAGKPLSHGATLIALRMEAEHCHLIVSTPDGTPEAVSDFPIGDARIAREVFGNRLPNAYQLEVGIAEVEDQIMQWRSQSHAHLLLLRTESSERLRAGLASGEAPDAGDIERGFSRLAQVAEGSPATHQGIPDDPRFAACLLILREAIHHWQVDTLHWA